MGVTALPAIRPHCPSDGRNAMARRWPLARAREIREHQPYELALDHLRDCWKCHRRNPDDEQARRDFETALAALRQIGAGRKR